MEAEPVRRSQRSNLGVPAIRMEEDVENNVREAAPSGQRRGRKCNAREGGRKCMRNAEPGSERCEHHRVRVLAPLEVDEDAFPLLADKERRQEIHRDLHQANSEKYKNQITCGVCARKKDRRWITQKLASEVPYRRLLKVPSSYMPLLRRNHRDEWDALFSYGSPELDFHFFQREGLRYHPEAGEMEVSICDACLSDLKEGDLPLESLANGTFTGPIAPVLSALSVAESIVIALSRTTFKSMFYLRSKVPSDGQECQQRASKGHWLAMPQHLGNIMEAVSTLPHTPNQLAAALQVAFVGPPPYNESHINAVFSVNPHKIHAAFVYLSTRHPGYSQVEWDPVAAAMYDGSVPDGMVLSHIENARQEEEERDGYADAGYADEGNLDGEPERFDYQSEDEEDDEDDFEVTTSGLVDVNGLIASEDERRSAALANLMKRASRSGAEGDDDGDGMEEEEGEDVPMDDGNNEAPPENAGGNRAQPQVVVQSRSSALEYVRDPRTICNLFPVLYPYGVGGFCPAEKGHLEFDGTQHPLKPITIRQHTALLLQRVGQHFATHPHFLFYAYDAIAKQSVSALSNVLVKRSSFARTANLVNAVSREQLRQMKAAIDSGQRLEDNRAFDTLLRQLKFLTGKLSGSAQSRANSRSDIKALITADGSPSLWVTMTPPDCHSRMVLKLAGIEIDLDDRSDDNLPSRKERRRIVAQNPVACAKYFYELAQYFGEHVICADRTGVKTGIFGKVKSWYACVENQSGGTLHMHMLIWLHGQPDPAAMAEKLRDPAQGAFRQRLIEKVDSLICQDVDGVFDEEEAARNECGRGEEGPTVTKEHVSIQARAETHGTPEEWDERNERKRLVIANRVNRHEHSFTCRKKGDGCRFDYPFDLIPDTYVNTETGRIVLRRRDAWINGHNRDLITLYGGNCDVKQLLTGKGVLARVYYMSKYMTKCTPVAHRLVAVALQQRELDARYARTPDDTHVAEARRFITQVANRMGAQQEVPAVSAALYVLYDVDHFCSDIFRPLHLGMFDNRLTALASSSASRPAAGSALDSETLETTNLSRGEDGDMVEHNQVDDYVYRHTDLKHLSLYQFVVRYRVDCVADGTIPISGPSTGRRMMSKYPFLPEHPRRDKQILVERQEPVIPKIMGRCVPNRESTRPATMERYAKYILTLFKPWSKLGHLRQMNETWVHALARFTPADDDLPIIDHLQLLHRTADEVAEDRARATGERGPGMGPGLDRVGLDDEDLTELETEQMLQTISDADDPNKAIDPNVKEVLTILKTAKFLPTPSTSSDPRGDHAPYPPLSPHYPAIGRWLDGLGGETPKSNRELTEKWEVEKKEKDEAIARERNASDRGRSEGRQGGRENTGPGQGLGGNEDPGLDVPTRSINQAYASGRLNPIKFGHAHGLNGGQMTAFLVMVFAVLDRSRELDRTRGTVVNRTNDPTVALITGAGGTGKSVVLNTFTKWAKEMGVGGWIRRGAPTATAAASIFGSTLQSMFGTRRGRKKDVTNDEEDALGQEAGHIASAATTEIFRDAHMLAIDEISMCGHNLFTSIYNQTCGIFHSGSGQAFGGLNVIMFGDMHQFGPVLDRALYLDPLPGRNPQPGHTPINRFMTTITHVVKLKRAMRQLAGEREFSELLDRIRERRLIEGDFDLIQSHILGTPGTAPDISGAEWRDAMIIVRRHAIRRAINEASAKRHAEEKRQPCYLVSAKYFYGRGVSASKAERDQLKKKSPNDHGQTDPEMYLTVGSPVVFGHNLTTPQGITNGAFGEIAGFRFDEADGDGNQNVVNGVHHLVRPPRIVFVKMKTPHPHLATYTGLPHGVFPVQPVPIRMNVKLKGMGTKRTYLANQLPLFPAYAITGTSYSGKTDKTDYKSQGFSANRVIVDLALPPQTVCDASSAYVQLSRGRSWGNVAVLRDFDMFALVGSSRETERMMTEMSKLDVKAVQTDKTISERIIEEGWQNDYREYERDMRSNDRY